MPPIAPTILAFDCATSPASVALGMDGVVTATEIPHGAQASRLVAEIDALLRANNVAYPALNGIVTSIGPGSFTGLRIALATLHGLALAHPSIAIRLTTTPVAIAHAVADRAETPTHFSVAMDAGKNEFYTQDFILHEGVPQPQGIIRTHPMHALAAMPLPCFGNALTPGHPHYISGVDAGILVRHASYFPVAPLADALPYYIRPADAKLPG